MRLGPFLRAGIVSSVWAFIGGTLFFSNRAYGEHAERMNAGRTYCLERSSWDQCVEVYPLGNPDGLWTYSMGEAAAHILLGWIIGVALYWSVRWVLKGVR